MEEVGRHLVKHLGTERRVEGEDLGGVFRRCVDDRGEQRNPRPLTRCHGIDPLREHSTCRLAVRVERDAEDPPEQQPRHVVRTIGLERFARDADVGNSVTAVGQFVEQARFADARRSRQLDARAMPATGTVERGREQPELLFPSDERRPQPLGPSIVQHTFLHERRVLGMPLSLDHERLEGLGHERGRRTLQQRLARHHLSWLGLSHQAR